MSIQEFILANSSHSFINGIYIKGGYTLSDLDIYGTHERSPNQWTKVNFQRIEFENIIYLKFHAPNNLLHFKILNSGILPSDDITPEFSFDYTKPRTLEEIIKHLSISKIAFVGCARNCADNVTESINTLKSIARYFLEYKIIIFENDSIDETGALLSDLSKNKIIELIQHKNLDTSFPHRTQRLSYARNKLFSNVLSLNYDYYCVADLDGVIGKDFDCNTFLSNFKFLDCWDAVFPVNKGIYYDAWAFRHPTLWPWDYEREMNKISPILGDDNILEFYTTRFQNLNFRNLKGWLNVDSAFGGLGLYKIDKFKY